MTQASYYRLLDDMRSVHRWHVGELQAADGVVPDVLSCVPFRGAALHAEVHHVGYVLDFSCTSFNEPLAASVVAEAMLRVAPHDVQLIPVDVAGRSGLRVVNVLTEVDCVDQTRSEGVVLYGPHDGFEDRVGHFRQITRLVIDPTRVPPDAHVFRPRGWNVAMIVSQSVREAIEDSGASGAVFLDVTP